MSDGDKVFYRRLSAAIGFLGVPGRMVLMKHLLEVGPVTAKEATVIVGSVSGHAPQTRNALRDLRIMTGLGLAVEEDGHFRAAQSCVSGAVRRALCPKRTVFLLSEGKLYNLHGAYATRGGAEAAEKDIEEMEREHRFRHPLTPVSHKEIEELDVGG